MGYCFALETSRDDDIEVGLPADYPVDSDIVVGVGDTPSAGDRSASTDAPTRADESVPTGAADGGESDPLTRYADRWYRPDSRTYDYAVRTPDGGRRYLKTRDGAVRALERYYN